MSPRAYLRLRRLLAKASNIEVDVLVPRAEDGGPDVEGRDDLDVYLYIPELDDPPGSAP